MSQSSELAGGAGFSFEDAVAASYLAALLQEAHAPGIENRIVCRVAQQQGSFGEPLDDLIVDFRSSQGEIARLSLQIKRALVISAATTNSDFRDVVRDCLLTLSKPDFRKGVDRFGVAVGEIASAKARDLRQIAEFARASTTAFEFTNRFLGDGNASQEHRTIKSDVVALIEAASGRPCSSEDEHAFFSHLVLIEFDFLHEGGTSAPTAINGLKTCLASSAQDQASAAWAELCRLARDGAGKSASYDRPKLVRALSQVVKLTASGSLRGDLSQITQLSRQWLIDIDDDVGGKHLRRDELQLKLDEAIRLNRIVQITGLPGCGKSVLLRSKVEMELARGPVLFIKSGRLDGNGWSSFAHANGLSNAPIIDLLTELGATGCATFFIDGIDRIEKQHRPIVTDVLQVILNTPELKSWRVVMSLRDSGIEPLRNWLGKTVGKAGIGSVEVGSLSDVEATALACAKPLLAPFLFGSSQVKEIVRRPFFAKILCQSFESKEGNKNFTPQSEIDLVENWWVRGGYDSDGQNAIERQRAIVELGTLKAHHLDQEIALRDLSASTVAVIETFVSDGILKHHRRGHTVRFAHDIFFEWAVLHVLLDASGTWLEEIKLCGEPPAIARSVELLSQKEFEDTKRWVDTLKQIDRSTTRSQWTRAWLLAPLSMPNFAVLSAAYAEAVEADDFKFLKRALVWFQAERTTPNQTILKREDLPPDQRVRVADLFGWPSDFAVWSRFIVLLIRRIDEIPFRLRPDIVSIFEVWQNALAGVENDISNRLLEISSAWLLDIESREARDAIHADDSPWEQLSTGLASIRQSLARLIYRSATVRPDLLQLYLAELIKLDRLRRERFEEVLSYAPLISEAHAVQLVDLTLKRLLNELPNDQISRQREEERRAAERRRAILAKAPNERTRLDELELGSGLSMFGHSFGHHDWEDLCIRDEFIYFPASPLREPFHSLFQKAPDQAFQLLNRLSNHAMEAWRQLHRLSYDSKGTPIPLHISFPWGVQQFWGGSREYLWSRAVWGPKPLLSAYLALENWAFEQLELKRPVDELIEQIVRGNECIAVLGVAVALACETEAISEVIIPIATSQRILEADEARAQHDLFDYQSGLIGFNGKPDAAHIDAVKAINERSVRKQALKNLVGKHFLSAGGVWADRLKSAIYSMRNELGYQYEEWRNEPGATQALQERASEFEAIVDIENYRTVKFANEPNTIGIIHVSPKSLLPETKARVDAAERSLKRSDIWVWAAESLEKGVIGPRWTIASAIAFAKELQREPIAEDDDTLGLVGPGAFAAAATMALSFPDGVASDDLAWARETVYSCRDVEEEQDELWSPMSVIPWHPGIFAAQGLAADIRNGTADPSAPSLLFSFIAHPLEGVSQAAVKACVDLWDIDPQLAWTALHLSLALCTVPPRKAARYNEPDHTADARAKAIEIATAIYSGGAWEPLPLPPERWIEASVEEADPTLSFDEVFEVEDDIESSRRFIRNPTWWNAKHAAASIACVPVQKFLCSCAKDAFEQYVVAQLEWTIRANSPPSKKVGERNSETDLFEWNRRFASMLGWIVGCYALDESRKLFLEPVFALEDDDCFTLLEPLINTYICAYVYDSASIPADAAALLTLCLDRVLEDRSFKEGSYRAGKLGGYHLPEIASELMLVSVEHAGGAARYVNGDWSEIDDMLPIIDRFVRAAGWSSTIMAKYLTLCERAKSHFPAELFADEVLDVIGKGRDLHDWRGTFLPARIAAMVQLLADRETPMPNSLGQKLLRILDILVDMGDRRSAALQLSEAFREIKI